MSILKVFKVEDYNLKDGDTVEAYFKVVDKKPPIEYSKGFRFTLVFDSSSEITRLNYWGGKEIESVNSLYDSIQGNQVVFAAGTVKTFQDRKEINVNFGDGQLRVAKEREYEIDDFIPKSNQDLNVLWEELVITKNEATNPFLRSLLDIFLGDPVFESQFKRSPAAMYIHHATLGGLLEHTWEVVRICRLISEIHPSLDKDLLYTAAILHDIGKIEEYEIKKGIQQTPRGMLLGHTQIGVEMIQSKIETLDDFPEKLRDKLIHMILSHQGKAEYGAGQTPKTPEAATLFQADNMSAQITQYIRTKKDAKTKDFKSRWNRRIGAVYLE